jgi:carbon storage regulator|tara:strand:+ start:699 stop:890 length:192 start_codon:yes stop_codon:yes gene_type:complete
MLIVTRTPGETICIDDGNGNLVKVTVLGVKGNQVRVGVVAPKTMAVDREEIYKRKKAGVPVGA